MNDTALRLIYVLTDLIAPLVCGYFLHQKNILSDEAINRLIKLNVRCVYTLLSLLSFWVLPLSWELAWLPVFGLIYVLLPGLIGSLTFARRHKNPLNRGAYILSAMLSNIGTLGGVCAFILYNEAGFAYAQILGACQNVMLVLVCFPVAQYYYNQHKRCLRRTSRLRTLRDMFLSWNQVSLLGMLVGFLLNMNGIPRPEILAPVFQSLVHVGAWIALLPVGFMINFHRAKVYYGQTIDLIFLRFLIVPACIYFASRLVFADPVLLNSLLLFATVPTAINAVLTARIYKLHVDFTVASFLLTTVLYLFLIFPALFFFLQ